MNESFKLAHEYAFEKEKKKEKKEHYADNNVCKNHEEQMRLS